MDYNQSTSMCPKLIRVGNSCYRRLDCDPDGKIDDLTLGPQKTSTSHLIKTGSEIQKYLVEKLDSEKCFTMPDDENDTLELSDEEEFNEGKKGFVLKIHLYNLFYRYIIGKRGQTKMNIEEETGTIIQIPYYLSNNQPLNNFIGIYSPNKPCVIKAFRRIKDLEQNFRKKLRLTHFVSIPIISENIKRRFQEFKSSILSDPKCSTAKCINETFFQSENRLHLTLKILYIGDYYERKKATKHLEHFHQNFLQPLLSNEKEPIMIHMKGIDIMNDDPTEAKILYAKVSEVGNRNLLKRIVNEICDRFNESGLVCESGGLNSIIPNSEWKVKLHVTLMNTRFPLKDSDGNINYRNNNFKRNTMDVSNILKNYEDYEFGLVKFNQIHISTIDNYGENGFYYPLSKIFF